MYDVRIEGANEDYQRAETSVRASVSFQWQSTLSIAAERHARWKEEHSNPNPWIGRRIALLKIATIDHADIEEFLTDDLIHFGASKLYIGRFSLKSMFEFQSIKGKSFLSFHKHRSLSDNVLTRNNLHQESIACQCFDLLCSSVSVPCVSQQRRHADEVSFKSNENALIRDSM